MTHNKQLNDLQVHKNKPQILDFRLLVLSFSPLLNNTGKENMDLTCCMMLALFSAVTCRLIIQHLVVANYYRADDCQRCITPLLSCSQ